MFQFGEIILGRMLSHNAHDISSLMRSLQKNPLGRTAGAQPSPGLLSRRLRPGCRWLNLLLCLALPLHLGAAASPPPQERDQVDQIALSQPLVKRWQYASDLTINLTPATDGERVYLPLTAGMLVTLRAADGQFLWRADIGGEISASPVADRRGVYIASRVNGALPTGPQALGAVRAIGRDTGVTLWMRTLPLPFLASLAMNQTTLFGGTGDGRVYALDKANGEIHWIFQHSAAFNSYPLVSESGLYIGSEDGTVFALDQNTGKVKWRYRTRGPVRGRVAYAEGIAYFGSADGFIYAIEATKGRLLWRARTGAGVQAVVPARGGLLAASLDNFVYFLSFNRGKRLWKHQLAGRLTSQPLAALDGALFTPLSGDAAVVLDLHDGKQLNSIPLGEDNSTVASPIAAGNTLFITTRHGLLAFSDTSSTTSLKERQITQ